MGLSPVETERRSRFRFSWLAPQGLLLFGLVLLIEVLRRPETILRAEFRVEDGQVFFLGTFFDPGGGILTPYQGYLHVVPRTVALVERAVPTAWAPVVSNSGALIIGAMVATFLASDRLSGLIPSRRLRVALAVGFVLLPATQEVSGSLTYVQWYLAVYVLAGAFATAATSWPVLACDVVTIAGSVLSSPLAVLFVPLYWLRAWPSRERNSLIVACVATGAAFVQGLVFVSSGNIASATTGPRSVGVLAAWLPVRLVVEPLLGANLTALALASSPTIVVITGVIAAASLMAVVAHLDNRARGALLYAFGICVAATVLRWRDPWGVLISPLGAQRYFFVPGALVALAAVAGIASTRGRTRALAMAIGTMLVIGVVWDFRLAPTPSLDWSARSACIGGPAPCVVPVDPAPQWSIRWPGPHGVYVQGSQ